MCVVFSWIRSPMCIELFRWKSYVVTTISSRRFVRADVYSSLISPKFIGIPAFRCVCVCVCVFPSLRFNIPHSSSLFFLSFFPSPSNEHSPSLSLSLLLFPQAEHSRLIDGFVCGDVVWDVFAGVGPFAIPAAKKGCHVWANDLNPSSYECLLHNAARNHGFITPLSSLLSPLSSLLSPLSSLLSPLSSFFLSFSFSFLLLVFIFGILV